MYKICWIYNTYKNESVYGEGSAVFNKEMVDAWITYLNEKYAYIAHYSFKI